MTAELVPATNMAALEALDPKAREVAVTRMLSEARGWLAHAVEATQPQAMAEFKAVMSTVAEASRQMGLAKDIQLDAVEMVRRAERGLGVAIREGQDRGEIASRLNAGGVGTPQGRALGATTMRTVGEFAPRHELSPGPGKAGIYDLADGVTDEEFERAISDAKAEENLSRTNVVRKVKGEALKSRSDRPEMLRGTRRIDVNRVVEATVLQVANPCPAGLFAELDWSGLDRSSVGGWVESLTESISALRSLRTNLMKESTHE